MDKIPNRANMIFQLFRKRERFTYQAGDALPQRTIKAFNVIGLARCLPDSAMAFGGQNRGIGGPKIGVRHRALAVNGRQGIPQSLGPGLVTGADIHAHDFFGGHIPG